MHLTECPSHTQRTFDNMGEVMEQGIAFSSPVRIVFSHEELESLEKEQLLLNWSKQDAYIDWIESQLSAAQSASLSLQDGDKVRASTLSSESTRRESILLMKLNSKEQEMHDLTVQIQEFKGSQAANTSSLRSSLLDPAVNVLILHLQKELDKAKSALEETQNELSAWKFTPDSNTGKRLMAKCRLLYQENEELGRMISSGRLAKLEGDLALQKNFSEEMKKSQSELDEFLLELDEDVEGMQSTIYFLQQQLRQAREQLDVVQKENETLRSGNVVKQTQYASQDASAQKRNFEVPSESTVQSESINNEFVNPSVDEADMILGDGEPMCEERNKFIVSSNDRPLVEIRKDEESMQCEIPESQNSTADRSPPDTYESSSLHPSDSKGSS